MRALALLILASSLAHADVRNPYKATLDVLHGSGVRATLKSPCGDDRYAYVVSNADAIQSITIGEDSMSLELVNGTRPVIIPNTFGGRGFVPLSETATLYVFADAARELVHVGIIVRKSATDRTTACAEKWMGKGKRR